MPLSPDLLRPIPGDDPSGENLYSTPLFEEVREARRQDDLGPQGLWEHDVKLADYDLVIKLTTEALSNKTKDLFLASWLTEALLNKYGFAGLNDGLVLIQAYVEDFWDTVYPQLEDGDSEFRSSPLEWLGNYLEPSKGSSPALAVKTVPIATNGLDWLRYSESRRIPTQEEAGDSDAKLESRTKALKEGKLPPEEGDAAIDQSPKAFYAKLHQDIVDCQTSLKALDKLCADKFGEFAPSFSKLQRGIEEVGSTVSIVLKRKREADPDPIQDTIIETPVEADAAAPTPASGSGLGQIKTRDHALEHVLAAIKFLRSSEPQNPVAYLLARALRWGELRAAGSSPDPRLFVAASTETRTQVKRAALDGNWTELLENCEKAAGLPCGRAWLDLQRYAIQACEELGEPFAPVARALKTELRALLLDYPKLPEMFLMDDTPTANVETQKWIRTHILNSQRLLDPMSNEQNANDNAYERALEMMSGGDAASAIDSLTRQLSHSDSGRGRFIRRMEIAQLLIAMSKESVAYPILRELAEEIANRKLEEWEKPELVARVLALLYRCMSALSLDPSEMEQLHTRICKLDVAQALSCME